MMQAVLCSCLAMLLLVVLLFLFCVRHRDVDVRAVLFAVRQFLSLCCFVVVHCFFCVQQQQQQHQLNAHPQFRFRLLFVFSLFFLLDAHHRRLCECQAFVSCAGDHSLPASLRPNRPLTLMRRRFLVRCLVL